MDHVRHCSVKLTSLILNKLNIKLHQLKLILFFSLLLFLLFFFLRWSFSLVRQKRWRRQHRPEELSKKRTRGWRGSMLKMKKRRCHLARSRLSSSFFFYISLKQLSEGSSCCEMKSRFDVRGSDSTFKTIC